MGEHLFCRTLLKEVMKDVRKKTTVEERKKAWVYFYDPVMGYEFHGPGDFYWYDTSPCCRWSARAMGWQAWLEKKFPENGDGETQG